jgi:hypothetical protein
VQLLQEAGGSFAGQAGEPERRQPAHLSHPKDEADMRVPTDVHVPASKDRRRFRAPRRGVALAVAAGVALAVGATVGCEGGGEICPEGQIYTVVSWVNTGKTSVPIYGCR